MEHHHWTRELLSAVASGDLTPHETLAAVAHHLLSLCPECQQEYLAFRRSQQPPGRQPPSEPSVLAAALEERAARLVSLHRQAEQELRELRALDPPTRHERVRRALKRFSSPVLADLLIEESRAQLHAGRPQEATSIADLAVAVIGRMNLEEWGLSFVHGLLARALAHKSNALRVANDLREAERELRRALSTVRESPDPLIRAEVSSLAASLRRDQRRFAEALQLLDRASIIYRHAEEPELLARALILKGDVLRESGDPDGAVEAGHLVLRSLPNQTHPELHGLTIHNLATALVDAGRYEEAEALLREAPPSPAEILGATNTLKSTWLRALIARGLGRLDEAESLFLEARDGFLGLEANLDAALVGLDLALLYLDQGRRAELRALAPAVWPILCSQDVLHREAMASFILFRGAIPEETVTNEGGSACIGFGAAAEPEGEESNPGEHGGASGGPGGPGDRVSGSDRI